MDSFTQWLQECWGKMDLAASVAHMKIRETTIQTWQQFVVAFIGARFAAGQGMPTDEEILAEWHKTHPPAHVISTPYGDAAQPIAGNGTVADLLTDLKALIARWD